MRRTVSETASRALARNAPTRFETPFAAPLTTPRTLFRVVSFEAGLASVDSIRAPEGLWLTPVRACEAACLPPLRPSRRRIRSVGVPAPFLGDERGTGADSTAQVLVLANLRRRAELL